MADATFTTVVARVDQALTNAIWEDQIMGNLNQLAGAHRNLLVNGGMEYCQRGAGPFTADNAYGPDRYQIDLVGASTISVTQDSSVVAENSRYSLKAVYTHSSASLIKQRIEDYYQLRGKTLSLSILVRPTTAQNGTIGVGIYDSGGGSSSYPNCPANTWTLITVTEEIDAAATYVEVRLELGASMTVYFDNAMLVVGPAAAPYQPLTPQEDLARCQRYYEVHGGVSGAMTFGGYGAAASGAFQFVPFAVPKGGTPTMTKNGTWNTTNCGQPSASGPMVSGYTLQVTVTALAAFLTNCNSTDDTITAEWNP